MRIEALCVAALLLGCGTPEPTPSEPIPPGIPPVPLVPAEVQLTLFPGAELQVRLALEACPPEGADAPRITLKGHAPERTIFLTHEREGVDACSVSAFIALGPIGVRDAAAADALTVDELLISNDAETWRIAAPALLTTRVLSLEHSTGVATGDPVNLRWSGSGETFDLSWTAFTAARGDEILFELKGSALTAEDGQLRFEMPDVAPGPVELRGQVRLQGALSSCEGPKKCTLAVHRTGVVGTIEKID